MLYRPEPLDKWIGPDIRQTQKGDYLDYSTGEILGQPESKECEQYRQRFLTRCKVGGKADRLVRIVDRYMPRVSAENRVYTMRFPDKVHDMLREARAIRRRIRARKGGQADAKTRQPPKRDGEATTPSKRRPTTKQKLNAAGENTDTDLCTDEPGPPKVGEVPATSSAAPDRDGLLPAALQEEGEPLNSAAEGEHVPVQQDSEALRRDTPPASSAATVQQPTATEEQQPEETTDGRSELEEVDWGSPNSGTRASEGEDDGAARANPDLGARRPRTPSRSPRRQAGGREEAARLGAQRPNS